MKKGRKIMLIVLCAVFVIALTFVLMDGTFTNMTYGSVWSEGYISGLENDMERMIAHAIRASSSHNTQPWLVRRVDADTVELYADMHKALPVVDGDNKQLLISQGTFIEAFTTGAAEYGYNTHVTYAELDMGKATPLIATIKMEKTGNVQTADVVSGGTINVENGASSTLSDELDEAVGAYDKFSYSVISGAEEISRLQEYLLQGTEIESAHEAATKELIGVFRWTEYEKNEHRYGLTLTSMPGIIKPFVQPIMKMTSGNWQSFGQSSIKLFKDRLGSETQYILIRCSNPKQIDYVYSGQIYQKLLCNVNGYSIRPAMQVLEHFDAMKSLNGQFLQAYGDGEEVMMVLGVQKKPGSGMYNPRHLVEDIMTD